MRIEDAVANLVIGPDGHGIPWQFGGRGPAFGEGFDCSGLVYHFLREVLGLEVSSEELWICDAPELAGQRLDEVLERSSGAWSRVGGTLSHATEIGDVIVSRSPAGGASPIHLSVVHQAGPVRVLMATPSTGVVSTRRAACTPCLGVYRHRGRG